MRPHRNKGTILPTGALGTEGVAAVEFAILLTLLLLIFAGTVEFGRTFWYYDALAKATRDAARMMSRSEQKDLSATKTAAQNLIVVAASYANLKPALTSANVAVACLDTSFKDVGCGGGSLPAHVSVAITGYTIDIGRMIPFFSPTGRTTKIFSAVPLAPHTTMPYVN